MMQAAADRRNSKPLAVISLITLCNGNPAGCPAIPGDDKQCTAADTNNNGIITAAEMTRIVSNVEQFISGCPP